MRDFPFIFISYREDDSLPQARQLHLSLEAELGNGTVFFDKRNLEPGMKWPKELEEKVRNAVVVLVLYRNGKDWLGVDDFGVRRIDNPEDWVRREVETALAVKGITVIPVLLNEAKLPPETRLPDSLKELVYCQHKQIREAKWEDDLQSLLKVLKLHVRAEPVVPAQKKLEAGSSWETFFEKNNLKNISGPWLTVNCDREEHYREGIFSDFLNNWKQPKNLVFLLSACLHQKPASLAKRLVYDLEQEKKQETKGEPLIICFRLPSDGKIVDVADLEFGLSPESSWANFWSVIESKLRSQVLIPDPIALARSNLGANADHIALVFRVTEQCWHSRPKLEQHIAFIISKFDNLPEASRKYLLFFAFEFKHAHQPDRLKACVQYLDKLDTLAKMLNEESTGLFVAHHKLFPPVAPVHIEAWFDHIAANPNKNSNRTLLDTLRTQLHPDDRSRPDFDMEDVEKMQHAAYQYINRPQPDSIK
jgi:hypothetical protein